MASNIGAKQIPTAIEATANQVVYFDATNSGEWKAVNIKDLPVAITGVTATTLGTALQEIADRLAAVEP